MARKSKSITIEENLLKRVEEEAKKQNMSVSRLIENLLIKEFGKETDQKTTK